MMWIQCSVPSILLKKHPRHNISELCNILEKFCPAKVKWYCMKNIVYKEVVSRVADRLMTQDLLGN